MVSPSLVFSIYHKYLTTRTISLIKVVSATFFIVCFLSLKKSTWQTRKNAFYLNSTALSFSSKSNFRILDIQVSWRHEKSVNEIWPIYVISHKKIFFQKIPQNCDLKTSSRPFCVCKKLSTTSIGASYLY